MYIYIYQYICICKYIYIHVIRAYQFINVYINIYIRIKIYHISYTSYSCAEEGKPFRTFRRGPSRLSHRIHVCGCPGAMPQFSDPLSVLRREDLAIASVAAKIVNLRQWQSRANLCKDIFLLTAQTHPRLAHSCSFYSLNWSYRTLNYPMVLLHGSCSTGFWGSVPSAEDSFGDCRRDSVFGCSRWSLQEAKSLIVDIMGKYRQEQQQQNK